MVNFGYLCGMDDVSGFIEDEMPGKEALAPIPVATGGNSRIFRVSRYGRWWAVKSVGGNVSPQLGRVMLEKEFNLLIRLNHPSVIRAVEFAPIRGLGRCIVMDWIDGVPLDRWLADEQPSRKVRKRLTDTLIDALAHIHRRGVTHRDLKPSNILIDGDGVPHIIDFGLGDDAASTMLKNVTGTAGWTAPEVAAGSGETGWRRADVYALGLILREVDAGWLYRIVSVLCCRRNPCLRPKDGNAVKRLFSRLRTGIIVLLVTLAVMTVLLTDILWSVGNQQYTPPGTDSTTVVSTPVREDQMDVGQHQLEAVPEQPQAVPEQPQAVTKQPQAVTDKPSAVKDNPAKQAPAPSAIDGEGETTAIHQTPSEKKTPVFKRVNNAVMVAQTRRDALKYGHAKDGKRLFYAYCDSIMAIGTTRYGWGEAECDIWRRKVRCDNFYDLGIMVFYK